MYDSWTVTNPSPTNYRSLKFSAITFFMSLTFLLFETYMLTVCAASNYPDAGAVCFAAMAWFLYVCVKQANKTRLYFLVKWIRRMDYYLRDNQ